MNQNLKSLRHLESAINRYIKDNTIIPTLDISIHEPAPIELYQVKQVEARAKWRTITKLTSIRFAIRCYIRERNEQSGINELLSQRDNYLADLQLLQEQSEFVNNNSIVNSGDVGEYLQLRKNTAIESMGNMFFPRETYNVCVFDQSHFNSIQSKITEVESELNAIDELISSRTSAQCNMNITPLLTDQHLVLLEQCGLV